MSSGKKNARVFDLAGGVFREFSQGERRSLIANLFGLLPQRGCNQACPGCSAMAIPSVTAARWESIVSLVDAFRQVCDADHIDVQDNVPPSYRYLNIFRDADPAHYKFATDNPSVKHRGLGDYVALLARKLGVRTKIITAGVDAVRTYELNRTEPVSYIRSDDLNQLRKAAALCGRACVSISCQTRQYRQFGEEEDAKILARTFEALIDGARPETEIFLDLMYYSADGQDSETQKTLSLLRRTLSHISPAYFSDGEKTGLLAALTDHSDSRGDQNFTLCLPGQKRGLRISPCLSIGRAAQWENVQSLNQVAISDRLGVLPGNDEDSIALETPEVHFEATRKDLRDPQKLSELVKIFGSLDVSQPLADQAVLKGNWLDFFRAEVDLSPPLHGRFKRSANDNGFAGRNMPAAVNLILSSFRDNQTQLIVPFKTLHIN